MTFIPRGYVTTVPAVPEPFAYWDTTYPAGRDAVWANNCANFRILSPHGRVAFVRKLVDQCEARGANCFLSDAQSCLEDLGLLSIDDVTGYSDANWRRRVYRLVGESSQTVTEMSSARQSEWAWRFFHQFGVYL